MISVLVVLAALVLAALLAAFLPGAGFIAAAVVVVLGIGGAIWLAAAGASEPTTGEMVGNDRAPETELLGPGGPDDPTR
jgi:hypothetical protein